MATKKKTDHTSPYASIQEQYRRDRHWARLYIGLAAMYPALTLILLLGNFQYTWGPGNIIWIIAFAYFAWSGWRSARRGYRDFKRAIRAEYQWNHTWKHLID